MAEENNHPEYQYIRDAIDYRIERKKRRDQIGMFYGIGPEPVPGNGRWYGWIEAYYDLLPADEVPLDWKPGDPTAADLRAQAEEKAKAEADYALARIVESSRGGRST
jgi:hypothetical protein